MPTPVVVVPCYDEARRLDRTRLLALAERGATRILFVDDGSRDATPQLLAGLAADEPDAIEVLTLDVNGGKAEAVRRGMRHALAGGAPIVGYLDADLSAPPEEYERLLVELERSGADGVLGARVGLLGWGIDRSTARHYLGRIFASLASLTLALRVYDTQCGAKAFRASPALVAALERPFRSRWIFDVELLGRLLASSGPTRIVEIPLRSWTEVGGSRLRGAAMLGAVLDLGRVARELRRP